MVLKMSAGMSVLSSGFSAGCETMTSVSRFELMKCVSVFLLIVPLIPTKKCSFDEIKILFLKAKAELLWSI